MEPGARTGRACCRSCTRAPGSGPCHAVQVARTGHRRHRDRCPGRGPCQGIEDWKVDRMVALTKGPDMCWRKMFVMAVCLLVPLASLAGDAAKVRLLDTGKLKIDF